MAATTMPPTTHALSHAERLRLIRSTRKLGALLGETPLLADTRPTAFSPTHAVSASTLSIHSKRVGRLFKDAHTVPRSSSLSIAAAPPVSASQATASHGQGAPVARPVLFLRLPAPAGPPSPAERTSLPSPLSPTFGRALNSPATPTAAGDANRRRKMAKLVRTLGENVPPELVFGAKGARRLSLPAVSPALIYDACTADDSTAPYAADEPFSFPSTVPYVPEGRMSSETRASSDTRASCDTQGSREHLLPLLHRREDGWSGEWGGRVGNMEDVVRGLRELKFK
ncbi:hypothetical protein FB451DRAFT_1136258 [Mycena latifolia]|nr:hypothetical protein FB451DRAFT_1136258 [Mycena latifolia]